MSDSSRIELARQDLRFEDYIQPAPKPPKLLNVPFQISCIRTRWCSGHLYAINVIGTIQERPIGREWRSFSILMFSRNSFRISRREVLKPRLLEMRWLKNKAFFGSITQGFT